MSVWTYRTGGVTIGVSREALGFVLDDFAPAVNEVAELVAEEARNVLPHEAMRRFIGVKPAGVVEGNNKGIWRLQLRSRRYGSGSGERLMRGVEVPVALVVNNSRLATLWEYGGTFDGSAVFQRRSGGRKAIVKGAKIGSTDDYRRMWQPLTMGGLRAQSRARLILKRRRPRR